MTASDCSCALGEGCHGSNGWHYGTHRALNAGRWASATAKVASSNPNEASTGRHEMEWLEQVAQHVLVFERCSHYWRTQGFEVCPISAEQAERLGQSGLAGQRVGLRPSGTVDRLIEPRRGY